MQTNKNDLACWEKLYRAAIEYNKIKPWRWMNEKDLFGVQDPDTKKIGYCCVFGHLGEIFALNVFLETEGLQGYKKITANKIGAESINLLFIQYSLMALFEDKKDVQKEDQDIIDKLNLQFKGRHSWPIFRSYRPSFYPWFLDLDEVKFLTLMLEQACQVTRQVQTHKNLLKPPKRTQCFVRVFSETTKKWEDQWLKPTPLKKEILVAPIINKDELEKLEKKGEYINTAWEVDIFPFPSSVKEEGDERPYFPQMLLVVHQETKFIIHSQLFNNSSNFLQQSAQEFLAILEQQACPTKILVKNESLYVALKEICGALHIDLEKTSSLYATQDFKRHMYRHPIF